MYAKQSRAVGMTLGVMLTALAGCRDESPTGPMPDLTPNFAVGDVLMVTNTSGGTEVGSLRWAASHVTGGEVITFAPGLAGQTIVVDTTVVLDNPVTIEGPADKGITISGGGKVRVLSIHVTPDEETVLRNVTIAAGKLGLFGGAGIFAVGGGHVRVENSTITGNETPAISSVPITLINTTVSGNTGTGTTVSAFSRLTLVNSTIAHNAGAGVNSGALILRNSIISNHAGQRNCTHGSILNTYEGKNLSDDDTCGGPLQITIADPVLGPLAANGGPTKTHALLPGSPAINAGTSCSVQFDQRYAPRDAACDLGAFEFAEFTTVDLTVASSAAVDANGWAVVTGTIKCSRDEQFSLRVRLFQTQKTSKGTNQAEATATAPISCGPSVRSWSVSVGANGQSFDTGTALAGVSSVSAQPWIAPVSMSQSVKLFKGRK